MDEKGQTSFYDAEELAQLGLKSYGNNVLISRKASIYGASEIVFGNNVRIDDFCILSGKLTLGNYIHVAAYSALYGGEAGISVDDFANISSRVCVYAVSDDYSGESMTNPMVPDKYKHIDSRPVHIGEHVIIGSSSVVLPGSNIAVGGAFGCFSLIKQDTSAWSIYTGIPVSKINSRSRALLQLQKEMEDSRNMNMLIDVKEVKKCGGGITHECYMHYSIDSYTLNVVQTCLSYWERKCVA